MITYELHQAPIGGLPGVGCSPGDSNVHGCDGTMRQQTQQMFLSPMQYVESFAHASGLHDTTCGKVARDVFLWIKNRVKDAQEAIHGCSIDMDCALMGSAHFI
jgi:hypothetical protein